MEDLREVGNKVIDAIRKRKPVDAGDLVLGIGELIEDLRREHESPKLDHLEGLFRELAYGEEYELRNNRAEEEEEEDNNQLSHTNPFGGGGIWASGVCAPISGTLMPPSSQLGPPIKNQNNQLGNQQVGFPPVLPPKPYTPTVSFDDDDDYDDPFEDEQEQEPEPEEPPKPFKRRWWMSKA